MTPDYSIRLTRSFRLSGDRSSTIRIVETLADAASFLDTSIGGVPWDEALLAAREAVENAARTGVPDDVRAATEKLERYFWTQQII